MLLLQQARMQAQIKQVMGPKLPLQWAMWPQHCLKSPSRRPHPHPNILRHKITKLPRALKQSPLPFLFLQKYPILVPHRRQRFQVKLKGMGLPQLQ